MIGGPDRLNYSLTQVTPLSALALASLWQLVGGFPLIHLSPGFDQCKGCNRDRLTDDHLQLFLHRFRLFETVLCPYSLLSFSLVFIPFSSPPVSCPVCLPRRCVARVARSRRSGRPSSVALAPPFSSQFQFSCLDFQGLHK